MSRAFRALLGGGRSIGFPVASRNGTGRGAVVAARFKSGVTSGLSSFATRRRDNRAHQGCGVFAIASAAARHWRVRLLGEPFLRPPAFLPRMICFF
jgi:hypothetical protein